MKVIIAGPRDFFVKPYVVAQAVHESGFEITELVHGAARGIDECGQGWAEEVGIEDMPFPAAWDYWRKRGNPKKAGPIRNRQMAGYADALIVVRPEGSSSPGTNSMIREAARAGIPVYVKGL